MNEATGLLLVVIMKEWKAQAKFAKQHCREANIYPEQNVSMHLEKLIA